MEYFSFSVKVINVLRLKYPLYQPIRQHDTKEMFLVIKNKLFLSHQTKLVNILKNALIPVMKRSWYRINYSRCNKLQTVTNILAALTLEHHYHRFPFRHSGLKHEICSEFLWIRGRVSLQATLNRLLCKKFQNGWKSSRAYNFCCFFLSLFLTVGQENQHPK